MLKRCIKMFNLICSNHNFLLDAVDTQSSSFFNRILSITSHISYSVGPYFG